MRPRLAAVIPAAGLSRRMGREKIELAFGSSTVLETVLDKLARAGVDEIVVVLRQDLSRCAELAGRSNARVVVNPRPDENMLASIRLGLAALSDSAEAMVLWPCDHPAVALSTLSTLLAAADRSRAVIPRHQGRRGHPVIVGADLFPAIATIPTGEGLRHLWRARPDAVTEMDISDPGILVDLDTPEDYERSIAQRPITEKGDQEVG